MSTLRYVMATFILPDNRILLQRQRLNELSATQWRATAEYLIGPGDTPHMVLSKRVLQDFSLYLYHDPNYAITYRQYELPVIEFKSTGRQIYSYIIKIMNMWNLRTSRIYEFYAKTFEELLTDIYQNSINCATGDEKHSFNTIHVIGNIDRKGIIKNGRIDVRGSIA